MASNTAAASADGAAAAAAPVETDIFVAGPHALLPAEADAAVQARPSKALSASGMVWAARFLEARSEKPCCHLGRNMALVELPMSVVVVGTNAVTVLTGVGGGGRGHAGYVL